MDCWQRLSSTKSGWTRCNAEISLVRALKQPFGRAEPKCDLLQLALCHSMDVWSVRRAPQQSNWTVAYEKQDGAFAS